MVDYSDENKAYSILYTDRNIFNEQISDTNEDILHVGNGNLRPTCHISDDERTMFQRGLLFHHSLCQSLAGHEIQRPSRSEWNEDRNAHTIMS